MTKVIYGRETLTPISTWGAYDNHDYSAGMLMVEGKKHKIFITPQQREDLLEGYKDGFILQINEKRIGCYWLFYDVCDLEDKDKESPISLYSYEFEITKDGKKIWHLDEIGIEPSMSSTNQFTTHQYFDSDDEMAEGIKFIQKVFSEYDGNTKNVDCEMIWTKKRPSEIHFSQNLQNKIDNGELIRENT